VAEIWGSGVNSAGGAPGDELVDVSDGLEVLGKSLLVGTVPEVPVGVTGVSVELSDVSVGLSDGSVGVSGAVLADVPGSLSGAVPEVLASSATSAGRMTITSAPTPPGTGRRTAVAA